MKRAIKVAVVVCAVSLAGFLLLKQSTRQPSNDHMAMNHKATQEPNRVKPGPNEVAIQGFAFSPSKISIKKGTTLTWTNYDSAHHDITPDAPNDSFKASELLAKGESYSYTFNSPGNYNYHCSPHPYMKATVEVTE